MRTRLRVRWRERRWGYRRFPWAPANQSPRGGPVRAGGGAQAAYGNVPAQAGSAVTHSA